MKRKILSFLLALLTVLTAMPLYLLSGSAEEGNAPQTEKYDYSKLYVDGAYVLLMAYNGDDSVVLNQDGSGTWLNKVADPSGEYDVFDLVGKVGTIGSGKKTYFTPKTHATAELISFSGITYDKSGNPMYGAVSTLTREVIPTGGETEYAGTRSINHYQIRYGRNETASMLYNVTEQSYTVSLFIADASRTTYVYEKTYYTTVGNVGGTTLWQVYNEEPTSGSYTAVTNHYFTENLADIPQGVTYRTYQGYFARNMGYITGGWQNKNGGVGVTLNDAFYNSLNTNSNYAHYIALGAEYIPNEDYTVELVAAFDDGVADTDGSPMTMQSYFIYEGDGEWSPAFRMGPLNIYSRAASAARYPAAQTSVIYSTYTAYHAAGGTQTNVRPSNCSGLFHMRGDSTVTNLTFTKTATSDARENYTYTLTKDNAISQSFTTGSSTYGGGAPISYIDEASPSYENLWLLRNVSSTVYSVRVYPFTLSKEQKAQNHFADLCAYFALDMTGYEALGNAEKAALHTAFASADFTSDADTLQQKIDTAVDAFVPTTPTPPTLTDLAISFDGFTSRMYSKQSVRAYYTVSDAAIAALEAEGYRVRYGAIVGLGSYLDVDYRDLAGLTLDPATLAVSGENAAATLVYDTYDYGDASYSYAVIDEAKGTKTFTLTLTYKDSYNTKEFYSAELVSRAFLALTDADGNTKIHYIDTLKYGFEEKTSFADVAAYFVNRYVGTDSYKWYVNEDYRRVMTLCDIPLAQRIYADPPTVEKDVLSVLPGIVAWGDSLTAGAGGSGTTYETTLEGLIARDVIDYIKVVNMGVGGETSATICGRATAEGHEFTLAEDVTIPAGTVGVEVKLVSADGMAVKPLVQGNKGINNVTINGIEGTLTGVNNTPGVGGSNADMTYTFTRIQKGEQTACKAGTIIYTAGATTYADYLPIVFIGQNGGWSSNQHLYEQQMAIVGDRTDYIILGLTTQTAAYRKGLEDYMTEMHGAHYINLRVKLSDAQWLMQMSDELGLGIELSEADLADCAVGKVPSAILADAVHFNAKGYTLIGHLIYERMVELNYFAEVESIIENFEY